MLKLGLRPRYPRKGIHKGDFRCSVSILTPLFQFMSLGPAALSDNRPPARSNPSLSNSNVVFDYIFLHSDVSVYVAGSGRSVGQSAADQVHPLPLQSKCRLLHAGGCRQQGTMTMSSYIRIFHPNWNKSRT